MAEFHVRRKEGKFLMHHFGAGKLSMAFLFWTALAQELNFVEALENTQLQHSKDLEFVWQVHSPLGVVAASLKGFIYIPILVWLVMRPLNSRFNSGSPELPLRPCIHVLASWDLEHRKYFGFFPLFHLLGVLKVMKFQLLSCPCFFLVKLLQLLEFHPHVNVLGSHP